MPCDRRGTSQQVPSSQKTTRILLLVLAMRRSLVALAKPGFAGVQIRGLAREGCEPSGKVTSLGRSSRKKRKVYEVEDWKEAEAWASLMPEGMTLTFWLCLLAERTEKKEVQEW